MSSIDGLIDEAKNLKSKLIEDEEVFDELIAKATSLLHSFEAMNKYQEKGLEINSIEEDNSSLFSVGSIGGKGRSEVGNENRQLNHIENQNRRLKDALEDHQFALELIMSKYRQQLSKWVKMRQKERFKISNNHNLDVLHKSSSRVNEMQRIMREAINLDETNSLANEKIVAQLKTENETLRHLLRIAINFGSISEKLIPLPLLTSLKKEQAIENEKFKDAQKRVFTKPFGVNLSVQPFTIKTYRKFPLIEELNPFLNKQQAM